MDATRFDSYRRSYGDVVQDSIRFSGLKHDFFLQAKVDLLQRLIAERNLGDAPLRALDIGCGVGSLHRHLGGLFDRLDGCDISAESIARAREDNPQVEYRSYRPMRLPYEDAAFDVAFASCVVHHVPPADWPTFFAEMRRVLRKGGVACVIEHNPLNPLTRLAVLRCPFDDDAVLLGARRAAALMREAGFEEVRAEHFLLLPVAARGAKRLERLFARLPLGAQYACSGRA